jgi:hypothetical protein
MTRDTPKPAPWGTQARHRLAAGLTVALLAVATPALAAPAAEPASSSLFTDELSERLVAEFTPWLGNRDDTEALVNTLRSGQPARPTGAASVGPATGPMGYGEARLALKMAQGTLAQQGVAQPDTEQLRAALHGGVADTPGGVQELPGVLPLRAQGMGWAAIAERSGVPVADLMVPPPKAPRQAQSAKHSKKPGHTAKASKKAPAKGAKVGAKASAKKTSAKKTQK